MRSPEWRAAQSRSLRRFWQNHDLCSKHVSLVCRQCNLDFIGYPTTRYCSITCKNKNRWRERGGAQQKMARKLADFGLTQEDYDRLCEEQEHRCAICRRQDFGASTKKRWSLDHDHNTNKFRGLLCHTCNLLLGYAKDDVGTLRHAIEYLEKHSCSTSS